MSPEKDKERTVKKDDPLLADLFDAYKQSVMILVMIIIYGIIPGGIGYLGYYLAQKGGVDFTAIISDPTTLLNQQIHYGLYIMAVAAVLFMIGFFAAFLFTASRNDRIAKPLSMGKAYLNTWGILLQFAIIIVIFGGIYFGVSYVNNATVTLVVGIVCAVICGLTPLAMIFRTIDFLLELE